MGIREHREMNHFEICCLKCQEKKNLACSGTVMMWEVSRFVFSSGLDFSMTLSYTFFFSKLVLLALFSAPSY